jgi:hypothetical protein
MSPAADQHNQNLLQTPKWACTSCPCCSEAVSCKIRDPLCNKVTQVHGQDEPLASHICEISIGGLKHGYEVTAGPNHAILAGASKGTLMAAWWHGSHLVMGCSLYHMFLHMLHTASNQFGTVSQAWWYAQYCVEQRCKLCCNSLTEAGSWSMAASWET